MPSHELTPWRPTPLLNHVCFFSIQTLFPPLVRKAEPRRLESSPDLASATDDETKWEIDAIVCGVHDLQGTRSLGFYCYLLRSNHGANVLVDCSFSSSALARYYNVNHHRRIADQLHSLGLHPEDIQAIILTRVHCANCGNLSLFPNARIYLRSTTWNWMQNIVQANGASTARYKGFPHCGNAVKHFLELYRAGTENRLFLVEGTREVEIYRGIWTTLEERQSSAQWVFVRSVKSRLVALAGDCAQSCDKLLREGLVDCCSCTDTPQSSSEEGTKRADVVLMGHDMKLFEKYVERAPGVFAISTSKKFFPIRELSREDLIEERSNEVDSLLRRNLPFVARKRAFEGKDKCFNWTLEYLSEKCREREVIVRKDTRKMDYRTGRRLPIVKMQFCDYVREIKSAKKFSKYLAACNIKIALPDIKDDVFLPPFVQHVHKGPFLWIAAADHYEFCHMDPDDGLLIVCTGSKDVKLFAPEYIKQLYPNPLGSHGRTIQSRLPDVGKSFSEFPLFDSANGYETTLSAGDYLYIPAFYWHQVTSTQMSISINVFWGSKHFLSKLQGNDGVKAAFHLWLLNVLEQNREVPSFARILEDLPEQIRRFLFNQWAKTIDDALCMKLKTLLLSHLGKTRSAADAFLEKDLAQLKDKPITKTAKHTQRLRIRGLMHRSGRSVP